MTDKIYHKLMGKINRIIKKIEKQERNGLLKTAKQRRGELQ